jgi:hypothetical protein
VLAVWGYVVGLDMGVDRVGHKPKERRYVYNLGSIDADVPHSCGVRSGRLLVVNKLAEHNVDERGIEGRCVVEKAYETRKNPPTPNPLETVSLCAVQTECCAPHLFALFRRVIPS